MASEGRVYSGKRLSYPKIEEALHAKLPGEVAATLYKLFRWAYPLYKSDKNGVRLHDGYDYRGTCILVPRRFDIDHASLHEVDLLSRNLPLDIRDEKTGKRYSPGPKPPEYYPYFNSGHWWERPDIKDFPGNRRWKKKASANLTEELEEILGWELVMGMWDQLIRYRCWSPELREATREATGIETVEERKIRLLEEKDIEGKPGRRITLAQIAEEVF